MKCWTAKDAKEGSRDTMKGSIHEFAWMGSEDEPSKRYAAAKIYMRHLPNISQKQQLFHSFHSDISASRN
jgi:hypothetical protein